jgi:cytochrome c oxidase subunit 1
MGAIAFALFAGIYYWFPMVTGRWYQKRLAHLHFWLSMVGTNLTFFPMLWLGYGGMPRRYAGYDFSVGPVAYFTDLHQLATVGAFTLAIGQLAFVYNAVVSWLEGPDADSDPWDLEALGQYTHEWQWWERQQESPTPALADGGDDADDQAGD